MFWNHMDDFTLLTLIIQHCIKRTLSVNMNGSKQHYFYFVLYHLKHAEVGDPNIWLETLFTLTISKILIFVSKY